MLIVLLLCFVAFAHGQLRAGAASMDATLPTGAPLAGYNHGQRRVPYWPLPVMTPYTTFMTPSVGVLDPNFAKALVLDDGTTQFCFVTLDGIGSDGTLNELAHDIAAKNGFPIPFENVLFSSSHSHSGPGAVSPSFLWAMAPATDLLVPSLQRFLAEKLADVMVTAYHNLRSAKMNVGIAQLVGVTQNRRARISHHLKKDSIDPNLGVIRVDAADGTPIATLWNFAIHGVCYGPENLKFSSDIMGYTNILIEEQLGGVSLFVNADAGDIDPADGMCDGAPAFKGSSLMANAVLAQRAKMVPTPQVKLTAASRFVDFGPTNLNFTLGRWDNCTHGGPLDICTICEVLGCEEDVKLYSAWIEDKPKFTALAIEIASKRAVITSLPGEPLLDLGYWVRNGTARLAVDYTLLAGYSNSHMGYFATPDEYDLGGYESQLTFWGITTAAQMRDATLSVVNKVLIDLDARK